MTEASLPVVVMQTQEGTLFNELHGYTMTMDQSLLNQPITPLPTDKKLNIVVDTYQQSITGISYKIRDSKDMSLIENTTVRDYDQSSENIQTTLNIKNLITDNAVYYLEIILSTDNKESISYYTKIISATDYKLQDKIDFVLDFNGYTFQPDQLSNITKYIETKSSGDNTNYGKVNINCTQAQIGWGSLSPVVQGKVIPTINDVNNEIAIIALNYTIGAENHTGAYDTYTVNESYRIRQTANTMYLLNFDRETNQIFDTRNDFTGNNRINLGIKSDADVLTTVSENQNITFFINQRTLWCFSNDDNMFTKVFTFAAEDSDNIRERYDKHQIKILNVDNDGNCNFIVYGYMNRGEHEGMVGLSLFSYNYKEDNVSERLFIPINAPYELLSENVGGISYVSEGNAFYVLVDETLYSIDLSGEEVMTEVSGLSDNLYAVSSDGHAIAYSMNGELYNTDAIRVLNMEKGTDHEIHAAEGDKLKVIGYINNDLIYGTAHASDYTVEDNGYAMMPMYKLNIMDSEYNIIKEYEEPEIYISEATVNKQRINLSRMVKSGDTFESTTMDQLINREENVLESESDIDVTSSEARLKEVVMILKKASSDYENVALRYSKEVTFIKDKEVKLNGEFTGKDRYYAYGYGKYEDSYTKLSLAINKANDNYGYVLDNENHVIWKRYKNTSAAIKGISSSGCAPENSLAVSVTELMKYAGSELDATTMMSNGLTAVDVINQGTGTKNHALYLRGVALDRVLYYISAGIPVIAKTGDVTYGIITAYDAANISYLDTTSGAMKAMAITEASKMFAQWGNVFITYYQ
jgi:hypothetical protein